VLDSLRAAISQREYAPLSPLPSERELARRFGVDRHHVRTALRQLVREGRARRVGRGGTLVEAPPQAQPAPASPDSLQCITFLRGQTGTTGALRSSIETERLAAYTAALDRVSVKMRFAWWPQEGVSYNSLLAPDTPLERQACVLLDTLDGDLMRWLRERSIPFVVQHFCNYNTLLFPPHTSVVVNKAQAVFDATRHVFDLGHRRIAFIGNLSADGEVVIWNREGYLAALRYLGLDLNPALMVHVESDDPRAADEPAERLIAQSPRPTAVVCQTDGIALGVLCAARRAGLRLPEDMSVVGFNDQEDAARADPPLTTFAPPRYEQALKAVQLVLEAASGRGEPFHKHVLPCRFVPRKSTAPASG